MANKKHLFVTLGLCLTGIALAHYLLNSSQLGQRIKDRVWGLNTRQYVDLFSELSRRGQQDFEEAAIGEFERTLSKGPSLSPSTGVFPQRVMISADGIGDLRYTDDGSTPTFNSKRFMQPLELTDSALIKVRSFAGGNGSATTTGWYLVGEYDDPRLDLLNLTVEPVFLYDKHSGIYANPTQKGRSWERPAQVDVRNSDGKVKISVPASVRIHGNSSRLATIKSFRLYFTKNENQLSRWVRGHSTPQSQWVLKYRANKHQLYADRIAKKLSRQLDLASVQTKPVLMFLNGKQQGVYELSERMEPQFLASWENASEVNHQHGNIFSKYYDGNKDSRTWFALYDDIISHKPYPKIRNQLDIQSTIRYFAMSIFFADVDRPGGNIDLYRNVSTAEPGKWKFAVWDFDGGLNYRGVYTQHDTLSWHLRDSARQDLKLIGIPDNENSVSATRFLRGLLQYAEFRDAFITEFERLLNNELGSENLLKLFAETLEEYEPYANWEVARFTEQLPGDELTHEQLLDRTYSFIKARPAVIRSQLRAWRQESNIDTAH